MYADCIYICTAAQHWWMCTCLGEAGVFDDMRANNVE